MKESLQMPGAIGRLYPQLRESNILPILLTTFLFTQTVMQRYGISRSEAKRLVRAKRNVANPNSGFYHQLKVWEACKYDIRTIWYIDGVKQYKQEYQQWLKDHEEEKRKRVEEAAAAAAENNEEIGQEGGNEGG